MSTTTIPAHIAAIFAANPTDNAVLVEMGHGYGKAQFSGTCRLTGLTIIGGATVTRKLDFWTRDGRHFEGYVPGKVIEALDFRHHSDTDTSTWMVGAASLDGLQALDLAALKDGTRIEVLRYVLGAYAPTVDAWTLRVGADGKRGWRAGASESSDKALSAAFKRTKRIAGFRIVAR